jgi:putative transposase
MPRQARVLEGNGVYHVYNRRTDRQQLFPSSRAYDDFVHLMARGRERYNVRICTYCLMETHWHQAIWVREQDGATAVSKYLRWLSASHALRFRFASDTRGEGHVYQDRYKAVAVGTDAYYLTLVRYIEANPLIAGLVRRAEDWPWSSLGERLSGRRWIVDDGPVPLPHDWADLVNGRCRC